jgi:hypothetical protein
MTTDRPTAPGSPLVAMIALEAPALPDVTAMNTFFDGTWTGQPSISETSRLDDMVVVHVAGARGALALAGHPIPWEELEGSCAAAWWWPEAEQRLKAHRAHLLATLAAPGGTLLEQTMILTRLVAAAAAVLPKAAGIYWGSGTLVHSPEAFIEDAAQMTREELPLNLWVDFRPQRNPDKTLGIFTTGMAGLGHREIEVAASTGDPEGVMARVVELAYHLVDQGLHPGDGEIVEIPPGVNLVVQHRPSLWERDATVLQVDP